MKARYPETTRALISVAVFAVIIGLALLWPLSVFMVLGVLCVLLITDCVRRDRKRQRP